MTPVASRHIAVLIVLILVQLVVAQSIGLFPRLVATDFYQFWAVGVARRMSVERLASPYTPTSTAATATRSGRWPR